jgi:alpha-galactosidase
MASKRKGNGKNTKRKKIKIVLIGAASASFGPKTVVDLFVNEELRELDAEVVLVDVDNPNLEAIYRFAGMVAERTGSSMKVSAATDYAEALPGSSYVITSVARKRSELWNLDFRVPLAMGLKHVLGENGGPGAAFHTMRSFELMMPIAREIERLAPRALLLNFTNPESRVCLAVSKLTKVRCVGLCHGVMGSTEKLSNILGRKEESLKFTVGGINHLHWIMKIEDARNGKDLYPTLRRKVDRNPDVLSPLVRTIWDIFGLIPFPSDSHIGEYLPFAHEFRGAKLHQGFRWTPVKENGNSSGRVEARERLAPFFRGEQPLDESVLRASGEIAVNIIGDIELDLGRREPSVNVPNKNGAVENLPRDAIVEVAATVDRKGIHPEKVGPLPPAIAEWCRRQTVVQELLVESYHTGSRNLLLQALLLDPIVDSVAKAEQLIDDMILLQGDFLPSFK